jgi:hypothetical protein
VKSSDQSARVLRERHKASLAKATNVLIIKENLWKNNLNFVKDDPIVCVYLISTAVKFSEEKQVALLSYRL